MNDTSYTWSSSFVLPYESEWSVREKFCYLNALPPTEDKKFKKKIPFPADYDPYDKIQWRLPIERKFRACPLCIQSGYHSVIHDLDCFDYCFIHNDTLLVTYPFTLARQFENGEPRLYRFLSKIRAIDLIDNVNLKMKIYAYKSLVNDIFPERLNILNFNSYLEQNDYEEFYKNTVFSLIERNFMPNNPWIKGKDRIIMQLDTSKIPYENRKCLWKAAKYCRKRNKEFIPSEIYIDAQKTESLRIYSRNKLGIIFKNYIDERINEIFTSKKEYEVWESLIWNKQFKFLGSKCYLKLSMYIIFCSVCSINTIRSNAVSTWKNVEYNYLSNFMPMNFFNINFLDDKLDRIKDKHHYLCFKEAIMRDALDYAIQELNNILRQRLINLDNGIYDSFFPIKFPQYIVKRKDSKWTIYACDPPEGLPYEYFVYKDIYKEHREKIRGVAKYSILNKL